MTLKGYVGPLFNRLIISIVFLLVSLSVTSLSANATSCDSVKITNHFTLVFEGAAYDLEAGTSTWDYNLSWDGRPPEISYFFIQLCSLLTNDNLLAVEPRSGSVGYNGNAKLYGIKWENINNFPANTPVHFSFTLNQLLAVDETPFAPKAGVNQNFATICGPSVFCDILIDSCKNNSPPVANCPGDTTIVASEFTEICLNGFEAFDSDGNLASISVTGGSFNNGTVCFTPVEGLNVITLIVLDSCLAADACTTTVLVRRNNPPVCHLPPDHSTISICPGQDTCLVISALDPDDNLDHCSIISGPGQIVNDTLWCYTPEGNETVTVTIECIDSLGLTCQGSFTAEFKERSKPQVGQVEVTDVFLCHSHLPVCVQLSINSADPNFVVTSRLGEFNPADSSICFMADTTGHYCNQVIVTNSCGLADTVDYCINVFINSAPVVVCPQVDTILFCPDISLQICIPGFEYFDVDDNIVSVEVSHGTLFGDSLCINLPTLNDSVITFIVTDNCGLADTCRTRLFLKGNHPPVILTPGNQEVSICQPESLCFDFSIVDIDGNLNNHGDVWSPNGTIKDNKICFLADTSGTYRILIFAEDDCLASVADSFRVHVILNQAPVVSLGENFSIELCGENTVCLHYQVSDDNLANVTSNYPITGDSICFVADTSGHYLVWVRAIDQCERVSADTIVVTVSAPPLPFVDLGDDINSALCRTTGHCIDVVTINNPALITFNREGYNYATGQFCFDAGETFVGLLIAQVTDSCGRTAYDTISVNIQSNSAPQVQVGLRDTTIYLCQPSYVCLPVSFTDIDNNLSRVQVNRGTYSNGQLCFVPYDSGNYTLIATATDSCGAVKSDTAIIRILTDQYVNLHCPHDTTVFMCVHDTLCFPIGNVPSWAQIQVSGINTWYNSQTHEVCFYVECGVRNRIVVKAITPCDTASCEFTVDVRCNQAPLVLLPRDTTITLCSVDSIYLPVGISDANHNLLSINVPDWVRYEPISSRLAFLPDSTGTYLISVTAHDSCGAVGSDQIKVTVLINEPPICVVPNDTSFFLCQPEQISLPVYATDANQGETKCHVVIGPGKIIDGQWVYQANSGARFRVVVECEDACEKNICRDSFEVSIQLNAAPSCGKPKDTTVQLCSPSEICLTISSQDVDGNLKNCSIISGPGSIGNPVVKVKERNQALALSKNVSWCYTPTKDTSFDVVVKCEDSCGAYCIDTFRVTVDLNAPPVVNCPHDTSLLVCSLAPVSISGFSASDPDGGAPNVSVSGGQLTGNTVTFNPTIGDNLIVLTAYDNCEQSAVCSTIVHVAENQPPVCQLPNDTTISGCAENRVCLPVSAFDPDGNLVGCQIVSGPGVLENGNWCYSPESNSTVTVKIRCLDQCEAYCEDSFTVTFNAGTPPSIVNQFYSIKFCDQFTQRVLHVQAGQNQSDPTKFDFLSGTGSIDSLSGVITYQPDTPGVYSFVVDVSNSCGNNSATIKDTVKANRPPEIIGFDSTVFLCQVREICFNVFGFDPESDSLNIQQVLGPGHFTQLTKNTGKSCFTPVKTDSAASYLFVFQVTDLCRSDVESPYQYFYDTVVITVILDKAPTLNIPYPINIFTCNPDSACFRIPPFNPEDYPFELEVLSGNAFISGDSIACLLIDGAGDYYVTIKITDSCGNSSTYNDIPIHVQLNSPPQVSAGEDFSTQVCTEQQVCFGINASDPDGNLDSVFSNYGSVVHRDSVCFEADTSGLYTIIVTAIDSCGVQGKDTVHVHVTVNQPPTVSLGQDISLKLCSSQSICLPYYVSDENLAHVTSNVAINNDSVCVTAESPGLYTIWVQAIDSCGVVTADTVKVTVTISPLPFVDIGNNIDTMICGPTQFCLDVHTIPNPASVTFNRVGYNPETHQFCWTANGTILDLLKVEVVDSCGRVAKDSISVNIKFNTPPRVQLAMRDTTIYLCQPSYVCLPVVFADSQNNISRIQVNRGAYSNGQVCFVPYDSGNYTIIATATDSCGAIKADTAIVRVLTDQYVNLQCPHDTTVFMCTHDTLCFPIGNVPSWARIEVSGINTWYNSQTHEVCFYVSCGVRNRIQVRAITPCDTIKCSFTVDVRCNQPPVVLLPGDTTIVLCQPDSVRIPAGISDPNHNLQSVTVNSWAKYEPVSSRVLFRADTAGVYHVQVTAVDSCGAQDGEDIWVTVKFNTPPQIDFAQADSVYHLCALQEICLPLNLFDAEGNITQVIPSVGHYNQATHQICFTPADSFGLYCVRAIAVDACGKADTATKCVTVVNSGIVNIQCPTGTIYDTLCSAGIICRSLGLFGTPDSIKTNFGSIQNGSLCFFADTSGLYSIQVKVFSPCTTLTCQFNFRVKVMPPVFLTCPANDSQVVCAPDTLCYHFSFASLTNFTVTPPAFVTGNMIGLPVLTSATYNLTLIGTGQCGADTCSFTINARVNTPPTVVSARDTTLTDCVINQYCVPFTVTDPDNNVDSVVGPAGRITGNQYCFVPGTATEYKIIIRAFDHCGAVGVDTTTVKIARTGADISCPIGSQNRTVCRGDSIRITVPITPFGATVSVFLDGVPSGYYVQDSALVIVNPSTPGSHIVRLIASAGCVTDTCNISLFVSFLERTTITCPSVIDTFVCLSDIDSVCFPVIVAGTNVQVTVSSGGRYHSGQVCVPIAQEGPLNVKIIGSGACGIDTCITTINVNADDPPVLHMPSDTVIQLCDIDTGLICIPGIYAEDESPVTITKICGPGNFQLIKSDSGQLCFYPTQSVFGTYLFCFEVTDGCDARIDTLNVNLVESSTCNLCATLSIDGGECIPVGRLKKVELNIATYRPIGGFELLLSFDASVTAFSTATLDATQIEDWEYFTTRRNSGACAPVCPSGLIRLIGLADVAIPAGHPPAGAFSPNGVLVHLYFQVTNDQNVGGQFLPINFVTYECADNGVSDPTGNNLYVDNRVISAEHNLLWDETNDLGYPDNIRPHGLGTPDSCLLGNSQIHPKRCVDFINGGICILSNEQLDDRGDINLNGVAYEVADAVVFTNYFIYGLIVFTVNIPGQIAATDINADGITLTVADLVLLLRIIIGDVPPIPKIVPHDVDLQLANTYDHGTMTVNGESVNGIGGAYLVYKLDGTSIVGTPELTAASRNMDMRYIVENDELRVLIYSMKGLGIGAGKQDLISVPFKGSKPILSRFDFADADGRPYNVALKNSPLPNGYELHQNYPNPFNPTTTLSFSLAGETNWKLTIFNVSGATVRHFAGANNAGLVELFWDGRTDDGGEVASGVYFYRLEAKDYVATKKMMMLK